MNRIDTTFATLQAQRKAAFIAYICAGDPSLEATRCLALELESVGVDILELGVPFSDPLADGTVNQQASERALAAGTSVAKVFDLVANIRQDSQIPIVLYTYLNPAYTYGFGRFVEDACKVGVDGLLLLDLPPDEKEANEELAAGEGLHLIRLIAPTTQDERLASLAARGEGFIYYVSREGVTGERSDVASDLKQQVARIRQHATAPVAVGFGISTPEQAASVAQCADGVVVGSAIVRPIAQRGDVPGLAVEIGKIVKPLVEGAKSVSIT